MLVGYVTQAMTPERRRVAEGRAAQLADEQRKELARAHEEAAAHWNLSPISTARLAMELYGAIKDSTVVARGF